MPFIASLPPRLRESFIGGAIGLVVALFASLLLWIQWGPFNAVSVFATDLLFSTGSSSGEVVIVAIDEKSVDKLGTWPPPRESIAQCIDAVSQGNPDSIGIDLVFADEKENNPQGDAALVSAVAKAGNVILGQAALFEDDITGDIPEAMFITGPFPKLATVTRDVGHLNVYETRAGVPEIPLLLKSDDKVSFALALQLMVVTEGKDLEQCHFDPSESFTLDDCHVPLGREGGIIINYKVPYRGFPTYSVVDVLDGNVPLQSFSGKTVVIGPYCQASRDMYLTPLGEMYGIEIQANTVETLLNRDFIAYMPFGFAFGSMTLLGMGMGVALANLRIRNGLILLLGLLAIIAFVWAGLSEANFLRPIIGVESDRLFSDIAYPVLTASLTFISVSGRKYQLERVERKRIAGTFERFVSEEVLREILGSSDEELKKPQGNLQEITVMFMDIRGFTGISEELGASGVFDLLNDLFSITVEIFSKHRGTVNKFIGDAVMVIFNAPLPQPDHALRAIQAGWETQEALSAFRTKQGVGISCGIGINTGQAMVGTVGTGKRMEYTCIGDTVNVAARLEGLAKGEVKVVIGPETYAQVTENVEVRPLPGTVLKGKSESITVYEVTSLIRLGE